MCASACVRGCIPRNIQYSCHQSCTFLIWVVKGRSQNQRLEYTIGRVQMYVIYLFRTKRSQHQSLRRKLKLVYSSNMPRALLPVEMLCFGCTFACAIWLHIYASNEYARANNQLTMPRQSERRSRSPTGMLYSTRTNSDTNTKERGLMKQKKTRTRHSPPNNLRIFLLSVPQCAIIHHASPGDCPGR